MTLLITNEVSLFFLLGFNLKRRCRCGPSYGCFLDDELHRDGEFCLRRESHRSSEMCAKKRWWDVGRCVLASQRRVPLTNQSTNQRELTNPTHLTKRKKKQPSSHTLTNPQTQPTNPRPNAPSHHPLLLHNNNNNPPSPSLLNKHNHRTNPPPARLLPHHPPRPPRYKMGRGRGR